MKLGLNPETVAKQIKWPLDKWPGNCYGIAQAMVEAKVVRGKAIYGHYHGYINSKSIFAGRPFTHHGWISCPRGGVLVDPTRWVFECAQPYIYLGTTADPDYDAGGNWLRMQMLPALPEPPASSSPSSS